MINPRGSKGCSSSAGIFGACQCKPSKSATVVTNTKAKIEDSRDQDVPETRYLYQCPPSGKLMSNINSHQHSSPDIRVMVLFRTRPQLPNDTEETALLQEVFENSNLNLCGWSAGKYFALTLFGQIGGLDHLASFSSSTSDNDTVLRPGMQGIDT
ncbi:hypothetical protein B0H10DRAFT_1960354 [Mycena sp. CBHHK59/15]|nr:hypothetical protein B0H10DRAFT_1960354 [Mycena sp. CBHHK59/15]